MSMISPNVFGAPLNFSAESANIVKRFHNETGSDVRDLNVACNQDSDCPMGNLCIDSNCYLECETANNDCPFWHTCRDDLHETKSVCGPYTLGGSKRAMPEQQQQRPNTGTVTVEKESWASKWFGWLGF